MEEILKQILHEIQGLKENQAKTDQKIDILNDRIELYDKRNKDELKQVSKKLDTITDAVATTMENITELKNTVEKQDVEIRVIKGGK